MLRSDEDDLIKPAMLLHPALLANLLLLWLKIDLLSLATYALTIAQQASRF